MQKKMFKVVAVVLQNLASWVWGYATIEQQLDESPCTQQELDKSPTDFQTAPERQHVA